MLKASCFLFKYLLVQRIIFQYAISLVFLLGMSLLVLIAVGLLLVIRRQHLKMEATEQR